MEDILNNLILTVTERIEQYLEARIFPRFEKYCRGAIKLTFSEEEAAKLLNIEKSTLADLRRKGSINYNSYSKAATYSLNDLQDFIERHKVKNAPQIYTVKREISLLGTETESKPRRLAS